MKLYDLLTLTRTYDNLAIVIITNNKQKEKIPQNQSAAWDGKNRTMLYLDWKIAPLI